MFKDKVIWCQYIKRERMSVTKVSNTDSFRFPLMIRRITIVNRRNSNAIIRIFLAGLFFLYLCLNIFNLSICLQGKFQDINSIELL